MSAPTRTSTRPHSAPDIRERVDAAMRRMERAGWRPCLGGSLPLLSGYLDIARRDPCETLSLCAEYDGPLTLSADRLPVRRHAGDITVVVSLDDVQAFLDNLPEAFPGGVLRDRRRVSWTDTLTPAPRRVRDPGEARRILRLNGLHASKRRPLGALKRLAERLVNAPVRFGRVGVEFRIGVNLGWYAFDPVERVVYSWGPVPASWAALAFEAWKTTPPPPPA